MNSALHVTERTSVDVPRAVQRLVAGAARRGEDTAVSPTRFIHDLDLGDLPDAVAAAGSRTPMSAIAREHACGHLRSDVRPGARLVCDLAPLLDELHAPPGG